MTQSAAAPQEEERTGLARYEAKDLEAAIHHFTRARNGYELAGDVRKACELRNNLCVAYLQVGRPADALEAIEGTPQRFIELGDSSNSAKAYGNLASAQEACGDLPAAEASYHLAAATFAELGDSENHALTLRALSQLQLRRGQPLQAALSLQSALEDQPHPGLRDRWLLRLLKAPFRLLRG